MLNITLETPGLLTLDLYYGPYSYYWQIYSIKNNVVSFSIHLDQQTKVFLKGHDFILTVQTATKNRMLLLEYYCKSEQFKTTKNNPTNAISTIYALIFNTKMHYSGYQVMDWTDNSVSSQKE
ncbi:35204_t:CDS:2 [Gigaspora margarita]|uniref:35204_t:CDS:1 n=1 Tax=Gigaspora margarita TaxID=4874 RepID=A0ABN7WUI0_GIGMA|nr:35204_t:CDS:2 [Gigaspora margarita]